MNRGDEPLETERSPEAVPPERYPVPGDSPDLPEKGDMPDNLVVLENSPKRIIVAGYTGDSYSRQRELARVQLEIQVEKEGLEARIVEFGESPYAGELRRKALQYAEVLGRDRGVRLMRRVAGEKEFGRLRPTQRGREIEDLQQAEYSVRYISRDDSGSRSLVSSKPGASDRVIGEPVAMQAEKNLELNPPKLPDKVRVRDIREVRADEQARFEAQLEQARSTDRPPEQLELPGPVSDKLEEMWQKSARWELRPPLKVREYGATLVKREGQILLTNEVRGNSDGVSIKPITRQEGDLVLGAAHTHPYESGLTDMAFSGTDFASFLASPESVVELVQSGDTVFALVKQENSTRVFSEEAAKAIVDEITEAYAGYALEGVAPGQVPSFQQVQDAAFNANIDACEHHGLVLYVGKTGQPLRRVNS